MKKKRNGRNLKEAKVPPEGHADLDEEDGLPEDSRYDSDEIKTDNDNEEGED